MDRPRFEHSAVCSDRESGGQAIKKEEHRVGNGRKMRGSYFRHVIKGSTTRLMGYIQGVGLRFKPLVVILGRRVHLIQPNLGLRLVRLSVLVPPHPHSPGRAGKMGNYGVTLLITNRPLWTTLVMPAAWKRSLARRADWGSQGSIFHTGQCH